MKQKSVKICSVVWSQDASKNWGHKKVKLKNVHKQTSSHKAIAALL